MLIDGIHIPLTVPFTRDGESYLRKLEYNVGRYSLTPAAGFVALTAGSEGAALSDEEIAETLRVIGAAADPTKVLVAAIAKDSVRGALEVARQAAEAGFDAVLVAAPPQWERLTEEEVMLFFRAVADGSPLPVMLGSESGSQGYRLSVDEVAQLARHGNVMGVYDEGLTVERYRAISEATQALKREVLVTTVFAPVTRRMLRGRWDEGGFVSAASLTGGTGVVEAPTVKALKTRTKVVGFQVMAAGSAVGMVELLQAGAAGAMLALSASAPQGCYEAYAAFKDGDAALAAEKGARLVEADSAIRALGIAGVKYGCDCNGYYGGAPRLPRLPLDAEGRAVVERVLAGIKN
ncbi:MAG TPA: dihydrodipicolinate synthase family protein [Acidobacteriaceae bacterium]|nr:dihydrodipicolinate synthase family protein [Acidobacteriaceae bacterium]